MTDVAPGLREISPELVGMLLGWVELALGPRALDLVVERFGRGTATELSQPDAWTSRRAFDELVAIAEELAGDDRIGLHVSLVGYRALLGNPAEESLVALGSVAAGIKAMADYTSKMSVGRVLDVVETDRHLAILEARYDPGVRVTRFNCDLTTSYFASLPELYGQLGYAVETACQGRGDECCRFEIRWHRDPRTVDPTARRTGSGSIRGLSAIEQLEGYHDAAAQMVAAQSVTEVLDQIVVQVSTAIKAPGFVLAVRTDGPDGDLRIHSHGVDREAAETIGRTCADEPPAASIVAPILQDSATIGHLVAVLPPGTSPSTLDVRTLTSFARYSASALDIVNQLEAARLARDTATALFAFSRRLGRATSATAVCEVLAHSLPEVIGCQYVTVWLRDPASGVMGHAAGLATDDAAYEPLSDALAPSERPTLNALVSDREPRFFTRDDVDAGSLAEMEASGVTHGAILPLLSGDVLLGVVTAAFVGEPQVSREVVLERATAVADQAAIALDNAQLAERLRHEALHDELTGLPQRVLAEDRCTHALAQRARTGEGVALLFLDLDGFKDVNDTHGHAVGDALLCAVAERLLRLLRATDTCARLGGDEFLVLLGGLEGPGAAVDVAQRIGDAFVEPFVVEAGCSRVSVSVTTSVGVALATDQSDFDDLLRRSDAAMYVAKRAGRKTYALAD